MATLLADMLVLANVLSLVRLQRFLGSVQSNSYYVCMRSICPEEGARRDNYLLCVGVAYVRSCHLRDVYCHSAAIKADTLIASAVSQNFVVKKIVTLAMDRQHRECEMGARLLSGTIFCHLLFGGSLPSLHLSTQLCTLKGSSSYLPLHNHSSHLCTLK
jgi:hypothetical protein